MIYTFGYHTHLKWDRERIYGYTPLHVCHAYAAALIAIANVHARPPQQIWIMWRPWMYTPGRACYTPTVLRPTTPTSWPGLGRKECESDRVVSHLVSGLVTHQEQVQHELSSHGVQIKTLQHQISEQAEEIKSHTRQISELQDRIDRERHHRYRIEQHIITLEKQIAVLQNTTEANRKLKARDTK